MSVAGALETMTFGQAVKAAVAEEMRRDPRVVMIGEDIAHHGGMFQVTKGLLDEFGPERMVDTPISESAFVGMAIGAALTGLRPVVELMFFDFSLVAMDQLINQIAKTTFMSGGLPLPITIRTQGGGYKGAASQHSQMLEALFLHMPGIKVVAPSNPADAHGLLLAAMRDDNPILFVEHKQLYGVSGPVAQGAEQPLGRCAVARPGRDATVVSYSYSLQLALQAADSLAAEGVDVEVIDARTLNPLDLATIGESLAKTHHLVIAHEAHARCGFGADLAAQVQEAFFDELDAPILRVTAGDLPVPFAKNLEDAVLPSADKIKARVLECLGR